MLSAKIAQAMLHMWDPVTICDRFIISLRVKANTFWGGELYFGANSFETSGSVTILGLLA